MQNFLKYFYYFNILSIVGVLFSGGVDPSFWVWGSMYGLSSLGAIDVVLLVLLRSFRLHQKLGVSRQVQKRLFIVGIVEIGIGLFFFFLMVISFRNFSLI